MGKSPQINCCDCPRGGQGVLSSPSAWGRAPLGRTARGAGGGAEAPALSGLPLRCHLRYGDTSEGPHPVSSVKPQWRAEEQLQALGQLRGAEPGPQKETGWGLLWVGTPRSVLAPHELLRPKPGVSWDEGRALSSHFMAESTLGPRAGGSRWAACWGSQILFPAQPSFPCSSPPAAGEPGKRKKREGRRRQ